MCYEEKSAAKTINPWIVIAPFPKLNESENDDLNPGPFSGSMFVNGIMFRSVRNRVRFPTRNG